MSTYLLWFWSDGLTRLTRVFFFFISIINIKGLITSPLCELREYSLTFWKDSDLCARVRVCLRDFLPSLFVSFSAHSRKKFVCFLFGIPSYGILCCHNRQFPPEYASLFVVFSFAALTYLYMMLTHCRWSHDHTTTKHSREEGRAKCACMSHRTFWHALYPKITGIYQTSGPCEFQPCSLQNMTFSLPFYTDFLERVYWIGCYHYPVYNSNTTMPAFLNLRTKEKNIGKITQ